MAGIIKDYLGVVLVIANDYETCNTKDTLIGTRNDFIAYSETFEQLEFKVIPGQNKAAPDIIKLVSQLEKEAEDLSISGTLKYTAFVFCGHGDNGFIFGQDGESLNLKDVFDAFRKNPHILRFSQLFFIDACRGGMEDKGIKYVPRGGEFKIETLIPSNQKSYVAYSTVPNFKAFEVEDRGLFSAFLNIELCDPSNVNESLDNIIVKVSSKMEDHCRHCRMPFQTPERVTRLSHPANLLQEAEQLKSAISGRSGYTFAGTRSSTQPVPLPRIKNSGATSSTLTSPPPPSQLSTRPSPPPPSQLSTRPSPPPPSQLSTPAYPPPGHTQTSQVPSLQFCLDSFLQEKGVKLKVTYEENTSQDGPPYEYACTLTFTDKGGTYRGSSQCRYPSREAAKREAYQYLFENLKGTPILQGFSLSKPSTIRNAARSSVAAPVSTTGPPTPTSSVLPPPDHPPHSTLNNLTVGASPATSLVQAQPPDPPSTSSVQGLVDTPLLPLPNKTYKMKLKEYCDKQGLPLPRYEVQSTGGGYIAVALVSGLGSVKGEELKYKKKEAEHEAARVALKRLGS